MKKILQEKNIKLTQTNGKIEFFKFIFVLFILDLNF